jgi:tRNA A37 N6-isopentenylltransferase MiaA
MIFDVTAIVGPTASGKTRLGVEVAHRLGYHPYPTT